MRTTACVLLVLSIAIGTAALVGCGKTEKKPESVEQVKDEARTEKVKVGDIEVAYRVLGKGYPLVMIMGFSGTMDVWDPDALEALSRKHKVIVFDNRGTGETTAGTKQFSIKQFAIDTAGFMDALEIERAHVLGWSMGTNIAQELVLDYPDKVNKLVLYAADPGGEQAIQPSPDVVEKMTDKSGTPEEQQKRLWETLVPMDWLETHGDYLKEIFTGPIEKVSPEAVGKQWEAIMVWPGSYDRLPQIESQTLLLTGTEDINTPTQNSLVMVQVIPEAWLVQFKGGGHALMYQYPEDFASVIIDFLAAP
ncbi:MAG: alpha/beta hydrolase [Actinobacteria bacterium]|nr:alpha/beta hydrolase [Actinomycetota bacterium]MBU4392394.1 alpha/beta hydrolase [Actinomycetota bacterium]MCG2817829.1 alpha/beta hydrolase [Actinomycetes bacterium]